MLPSTAQERLPPMTACLLIILHTPPVIQRCRRVLCHLFAPVLFLFIFIRTCSEVHVVRNPACRYSSTAATVLVCMTLAFGWSLARPFFKSRQPCFLFVMFFVSCCVCVYVCMCDFHLLLNQYSVVGCHYHKYCTTFKIRCF